MNKRIVALIVLCPLLIWGQAGKEHETRLFRLRYAPASRIESLLAANDYLIRSDDQMRVLVLTAAPERLNTAERMIQELDQPAASIGLRDVELSAYIIAGTDQNQNHTEDFTAVEPVIKQLKSIFPYKGYQVLNTILLRSREGEPVDTQGMLLNVNGSDSKSHHSYGLRFRSRVNPAQSSISLEGFDFYVGLDEGHKASLSTNVDLREGQKVVVGKTNIDDGSSGLFVVVAARILNDK